MNRRDFFRIALGLLGAAYLPSLPASKALAGGECISLDAIRRAKDLLAANVARGPYYYLLLHPDTYEEFLETMTPKERWAFAYRQARMAIKEGLGTLNTEGDIGSVDNVRFIVSSRCGHA